MYKSMDNKLFIFSTTDKIYMHTKEQGGKVADINSNLDIMDIINSCKECSKAEFENSIPDVTLKDTIYKMMYRAAIETRYKHAIDINEPAFTL